MSKRPIIAGDATRTVRLGIQRLRKARGWSLGRLSAELGRIDHPMIQTALSRIERGARRIDVDDLVAFAEVFGVEPVSLLTAFTDCRLCNGTPPAGFACLSCGTEAS